MIARFARQDLRINLAGGARKAPVGMSDQNPQELAAAAKVRGHLESPGPGQCVYDEAVLLSGWVHAPGRDPATCQVRAFVGDASFAETRILVARPDVSQNLGIPSNVRIGFRMLGKIPQAAAEPRDATLRLVASWNDENPVTIAEQAIRLLPALLRQRPYGEVVFPENERLLHRENIYGSGPPIEQPGVEVSNLIRDYLPEGASVVDVGCGAGAYGPALIAAGHQWLGLEANAYCCDLLTRRQLPFRRVDPNSGQLPGADAEWESAICIEVLEHVKEPEIFLGEIARLIRGRALFSVPNLELLPYFHDWHAVPWHLLEGDHKNFFTRGSLRALLLQFFRSVEIFSYGEHSLRTRDGVPLHVHLFAVADK
jgi:SAM-dependent methyltransferase